MINSLEIREGVIVVRKILPRVAPNLAQFPDRDFIKSEKSLQPSVKTHPPTVGKKNYTGKQESTNV